jgi:hypothetical protein
MKLSSLLRPVKDHLGLGTPGVYRIPCECGRVYIGQTGRSVDVRLKEHQRHIRLEHPDKSAVAEHSIDQGHHFQFHNSSIPASKTRYMDHIAREAIEIELRPYNINREGGLCHSKSWTPLIGSLDMTQGHLVTQFHIHSVFTNNPALPFYRSLGPRFVSGHLQPKPLSPFFLSSPPPHASPILISILASFLTWYFFAACISC